jgi:hypothetical protein
VAGAGRKADDSCAVRRDDHRVRALPRPSLPSDGLAVLEPYVVDDDLAPDPRALDRPGRALEDLVAAHRRPLDRAFVRQLHAEPSTAAAAFDRWLARCGGRVVARSATLRLDLPARREPDRLRVVCARLAHRRSPVAVAVELELLAWGRWRSVVSLHPVTPLWCGPRYFAAGHAVMDVVTGILRGAAEIPA